MLSLGQPVSTGLGWEWACPVRIRGLKGTSDKVRPIFGVDVLQALQDPGKAAPKPQRVINRSAV